MRVNIIKFIEKVGRKYIQFLIIKAVLIHIYVHKQYANTTILIYSHLRKNQLMTAMLDFNI